MLAYQWLAAHGTPVVFLHGLLGSREDWAEVFSVLQNISEIRPLAIDLPFHHHSANIACRSFAEVRQQLHQTLQYCLGNQPFYLVGYSLGGRLALDYLCHIHNPHLQGALLEGANVGLASQQARQRRWQNDNDWAKRFQYEPIEQVLKDWYQQAVFADLDARKRAEFLQKRQKNDGKLIAQMLRATSLAKQPLLLPPAQVKYCFVIGEKDQKFRQMATQYQLHYQLIEQAGHNTHQANPHAFAQMLIQFVQTP